MSFLALIARNRLALGGLIVMAVVILLALLTPLLPLAEPNITDTSNRFVRPFSEGAPLGTDHLGRDLLSRLMWGTRLSLAVGFAAALVAATLGAAIGIIAGYYGGRTDNIIMRGVAYAVAPPCVRTRPDRSRSLSPLEQGLVKARRDCVDGDGAALAVPWMPLSLCQLGYARWTLPTLNSGRL